MNWITRSESFQLLLQRAELLFGVTPETLASKDRHKSLVIARHAVWFVLRRWGYSYPEIGSTFGDFDHSTVMNALRSFERKVDADPRLREQLEALYGPVSTARRVRVEESIAS